MATKGIKNKKIEQTEARTVLDSVKEMELTKVINDVSNLQVSVQNSLASLSAAMTSKIQQMEQIDTAILLKESRLQELYGIENMAITLDEMKAQKENEEKEAEIQRQKRDVEWGENEIEREKQWNRQEEEWRYTFAQKTKKTTDDFEAEMVLNKRNESVRQEILQKSWNEREASLKNKEQEVIELQKAVAGFDAKLKAEVTKAEAVAIERVKKDYEHRIELLNKDASAEKYGQTIKVAAFEHTIKGLEEQVKDLRAQLITARTDAKDVASEALRSASGRQVADALQKVVEGKENPAKAK